MAQQAVKSAYWSLRQVQGQLPTWKFVTPGNPRSKGFDALF